MFRHTPIILLAVATVGVLWYGVSNQVEVNLSADILSVRTNVRSSNYFSFDQEISSTAFAKQLFTSTEGAPISVYQQEAIGKLLVTMDKIEKGDKSPDLLWQSLFYLYQLREAPCGGAIPEDACIYDDTRSVFIVEESLARLHFKDQITGEALYGKLLVELGVLQVGDMIEIMKKNMLFNTIERVAALPKGVLQHTVGASEYESLADSVARSVEYILAKRQKIYAVDISAMGS